MRMQRFAVPFAPLAVCALLGCGAARSPQTPESYILPLKTLRLYETGVGYFERAGTVAADSNAALPVPAGHLDDALKTLVVLSTDGKRTMHGFEFGSSVSRGMGRAMAGLPLDADAPLAYRDVLVSMKGAHVELKTRAGAVVLGRLIEVTGTSDAEDPPTPPTRDDPPGKKSDAASDAKASSAPPLTLVLVTDAGAIVRHRARDVDAVRPTDPAYAARLDAALDALSMHAADNRRMLHLIGDAGGPITLGYIAETPIWRTTYRLVLDDEAREPRARPEKGGAVLQGWALLHNDTDEDWRRVKVELVNGRPDSFLYPLAAPRYARRDLVHPENELSTVPQLMGRTVDAIWGDHIGDASGAGGLGLSGVGEGGGGRGEGVGLGSVGTFGHGSGTGTGGSSSLLSVGNLAGVAQATGTEAGALFTYALAELLALRAHASALVPFLQTRVDAEAIAWVASPGATARSGARFVNSTTQTLPVGTIAVFADGGFAGESAIDRMKPGERRFVQFGVDLDVELTTAKSRATEVVKRLTFENDVLTEHFLRTIESDYVVENRSGHARAVYLGLSLASNAKVTGADANDYDVASSTPVAVFRVASRKKDERHTTSVEGLTRQTPLASLSSSRMTALAATPDLAPADKAIALEAAQRVKDLEETLRAAAQAKDEVASLDKDLARLREDLKALGGDRTGGGGGGAASPSAQLVQRVLTAEDRHTALKKRLDALSEEAKTRLQAARTVLARAKP